MSINGLAVADNSTSLSVTGGTAVTFTLTSVDVPGGVNVADHAQADFRLRRHATFRNRNPKKLPDGTFSKAKRSFVFTTPVETADGEIVYLTDRHESEIPIEASAAAVKNHRYIVAQLLFDADVESFHTTGAIA